MKTKSLLAFSNNFEFNELQPLSNIPEINSIFLLVLSGSLLIIRKIYSRK